MQKTFLILKKVFQNNNKKKENKIKSKNNLNVIKIKVFKPILKNKIILIK